MSTTKIRFENGVAGQIAAHLLSDDGGHCLVHCMIPGGRPRFMLALDSMHDTSIAGAPAMATAKAFRTFVSERFA